MTSMCFAKLCIRWLFYMIIIDKITQKYMKWLIFILGIIWIIIDCPSICESQYLAEKRLLVGGNSVNIKNITDYYEWFSKFSWETYNTFIMDKSIHPSLISKYIRVLLFAFLDGIVVDPAEMKQFKKGIDKVSKKLLKVNGDAKKELIDKLPSKYKERITDLNSAVMGVPSNKDSDLDFTIAVRNKKEQDKINKILEMMGYKLANVYDENIQSDIKWHSYEKYMNGIEIEVKVRSRNIVDKVLIAHRGIKNDLTPEQKLKTSFVKSVLATGDKKTYKTFKYILYGAMFNGHEDTIIFRHD